MFAFLSSISLIQRKKTLASLFTFMLGFSLLAEGAGTPFFEDFESGTLAGWTLGSGGYTAQTNMPANGAHGLLLSGGQAKTGVYFDGISRVIPAVTPSYISFYVRTSSASAYSGYFQVGDSNITSNFGILSFSFGSSGWMNVFDGSSSWPGGAYVADTWYLIEFRNMNWTTRTYDFYVNGVLKKAGIKFRSQATTEITSIQLYNYSNVQVGFDDIRIGEATNSTGNTSLPATQSFTHSIAGSQLTLTWQAVPGATGYTLKYGTQSGVYSATLPLPASPSAFGPIDIAGIPPGTYYMVLNALSGTTVGAASTELAIAWSGVSSTVPSGFQAGTAQTYTLASGARVVETVTGATLTGPANANGSLSVSPIVSAPWLPVGGKPLLLRGSGMDYVDISVAHDPGTDPLLRIWGPHKADGQVGATISTWRYVLPHSDDGKTAVFRVPLGSSAVTSARASARLTEDYGVAIEIPTKEELAALQGTLGTQRAALKSSIEAVLNDLIGRLPTSTAALARQRMTEFPAAIVAGIPGSTCKDSEGSAYVPYFETYAGYFGLSKSGYLEFCGLNDKAVAYHEIGHYLHHLIAGDANYQKLARGSANYGESHIIGQQFNRSALIEDYAYLFEMLGGQGKTSYYQDGAGFSGPFSKAYMGSSPRSQRDYPAMEGFFATLVGAIAYAPGGSERSVMLPYQLDGASQYQKETVPVIGVGWEAVMNYVVAPGVASTDALWALIGQAGAPVAALAERFGWSYFGHGKVVDQSGVGVAGVTVEPTCKVGVSRYVTPLATTASDGSFKLARIFPGKDCVLVVTTKDGTATDWIKSIDAIQPTSLDIDLGSYTIATAAIPLAITAISPTQGPVGTPVTISGSGFGTSPGTVSFNGTGATVGNWSNTQIATTVPTGATTGNVIVSVAGKQSNPMAFQVTTSATPAADTYSLTVIVKKSPYTAGGSGHVTVRADGKDTVCTSTCALVGLVSTAVFYPTADAGSAFGWYGAATCSSGKLTYSPYEDPDYGRTPIFYSTAFYGSKGAVCTLEVFFQSK